VRLPKSINMKNIGIGQEVWVLYQHLRPVFCLERDKAILLLWTVPTRATLRSVWFGLNECDEEQTSYEVSVPGDVGLTSIIYFADDVFLSERFAELSLELRDEKSIS
jgi:hypothetical protein